MKKKKKLGQTYVFRATIRNSNVILSLETKRIWSLKITKKSIRGYVILINFLVQKRISW